MTDGAWIGEAIAGLFYVIVGVRLARLSIQTRERPERLLSGMFVFAGVSYLLYAVPMAIDNEALWTPLSFAGRVAYLPAPIFLALFTRAVFRDRSRFSTSMVYLTAALLVVGVSASAMMGDWEGFSLDNPFFWFEWTGYTLPFAWAGAEAFSQYGPSRRRHRLGLCDLIVCNRLLLWGFVGVFQVAGSFVLLAMYAEFETSNAFSAFFDGLMGGIEIITIALIWLVFFPPSFYRKFVAETNCGENAAGED